MPENNIPLFILSFLPSLIYALVIYYSYPKKIINLRLAFLHFLMGSLSISGIIMFHWIFPTWNSMSNFTDDFITAMFIQAFIQVGLLEESMKLLFYRLTEVYRKKISMPMSTMFYAMCVSSGFAVVENMYYIANNDVSVGWSRALTAIVIHMVLGLMMGYFISMGTIYNRKILFRSISLLFAAFFHGIYDFNLMVSYKLIHPFGILPTGMGIPNYIIIGTGVLVVFIMFHHIKFLRNKNITSIHRSSLKRL